jgi:hypothetical protein
MSRNKDFYAAVAAHAPVGVVAGEMTLGLRLFQVPKYLQAGGAVFIDSGAFNAFRAGTEVDFKAVLRTYWKIADGAHLLGTAPATLYVVAPDAVGDQQKTLALLTQYKDQLLELIGMQCNLIVPIQRGEMPAADMLAAAKSILGTDNFVAGIPSNEAAMSVAEVSTLRHHAFHILGRVQKNDQQIARLSALADNNPSATINADANWMRSRIPTICQKTDEFKKISRDLTWQEQLQIPAPRTAALTELIKADTHWSA